ncbi:MAG: FHA domain-containing protein [Isosphaeraceae bacterium]|nr:FHA domain-containing protein [Isosphaeraceae bacterium]
MSATVYNCPHSHRSETPDFCSVCGSEIAGAAPSPAAPAGSSSACPHCGTATEAPGQVFCEVCGYNFRTGGSGVPPAPMAPPAVAPVQAAATIPSPLVSTPPVADVRWDLTVEVDAALYGTPNPDAPLGQPAQTFTLFDEESLLGRGGTDVRVQIPIRGDAGVSRRQARFTRRLDGTLTIRDLGSANGTQLNGKELVAGVETPVADGDTVGVGAWTRITLRGLRR